MGCILRGHRRVSRLAWRCFLLWIFTDRLTIAFRSGWEGILGFLFLPYATLFYTLVYSPRHGVDGFGWVIVVLGILLDLSPSHVGYEVAGPAGVDVQAGGVIVNSGGAVLLPAFSRPGRVCPTAARGARSSSWCRHRRR